MAAASECDLEGFLKFVLQKTEELSLSKDGGSLSENFLSELLTHVDLLGKTTQLLHEIGDSSDEGGTIWRTYTLKLKKILFLSLLSIIINAREQLQLVIYHCRKRQLKEQEDRPIQYLKTC